MENNIYIFSRAIRTGKTTELFDWLKDKSDATGFLTPDVDERRKLFDISTKNYYDLELQPGTNEETIEIGKFLFSKKVFDTAKKIISSSDKKEWLIIDEAGKLEIEQDKGLEPELSELIKSYRTGLKKGKLLLVIRDSLLEKAIIKYELHKANIIHSLSEIC